MLGILAYFCNCYRTGGFAGARCFLLPSLPRVWVLLVLAVPSAIATAGSAWDYIFIFFDPCAGRHLLSLLLRQRK
jgi:hypothetical protein